MCAESVCVGVHLMMEMPAMDETLPQLPDAWVPDGAVVLGFAKHHVADGVWEANYPQYAIVGRGSSFEGAVEQANDLLEDYFRMCAVEGLSFDEAARSMPFGWVARELTLALVAAIGRRVRHSAARSRIIRMPAQHVLC